MGTSDRIERERQAKRALILEAARELFVERGYEAVTLREVAQRIEHSTTAVYVHFRDKRDLVEQMVAEDFAQFAAALTAEAAVQPPLLRLDRLGRAYVNFALTLPRHYQLLFLTPHVKAEHAAATEADPVGIEGYALLLSTLEACIAEGSLRPELTDASTIAQGVWACVHGLVSLLIIMGEEAAFAWRSAEQLYDVAIGCMMRGMVRDPEALVALVDAAKVRSAKPGASKGRRKGR